MDDIKKNVQLLALNLLIASYSEALENKELNLDSESREFIITLISIAREMVSELDQPVQQPVIPRPKWKK